MHVLEKVHSVGLEIVVRVVGTHGSKPVICDAPCKFRSGEESVCRETKEDQHRCAVVTATSRTNTNEPVWQESPQQQQHHPHHVRRCSSPLVDPHLPCPSRPTTASAADCIYSSCLPRTTTTRMAALWEARVLTDSARMEECSPCKNARKGRVGKACVFIARGKRTKSHHGDEHRLPTTMSIKDCVSSTI